MSIDYGSFVNGFELGDIYPNPFNPATTISFNVSDNIDLNLTIYDINGREISVLAHGNYAPGKYSVNWNASALGSGIYFARLSSDSFNQVQKLMLVK